MPQNKKTVFDNVDTGVRALYSVDVDEKKKRILNAVNRIKSLTGKQKADVYVFSAPGRIEVIGNHTDHQRGKVITSAIEKDVIAAVIPNETGNVCIYSEKYQPIRCCVSDVPYSAKNVKKGTSRAIVAGIMSEFFSRCYNLCGFDAYITSSIEIGGGLSSSAAFEVLIGTIFNTIANDSVILPIEIARIGQLSENNYFGKPCGLMDEAASVLGGCNMIDFSDPDKPIVEKAPIYIPGKQYSVYVVNTGKGHADLTRDYADVVDDMKEVAAFFGREVLSGITKDMFFAQLGNMRKVLSERAILRAYHYITEVERVDTAFYSLKNGDFDAFLTALNESGISSAEYLQNVYSTHSTDRSLSLAYAILRQCIADAHTSGACRVHGGGFMGTVLAVTCGGDDIITERCHALRYDYTRIYLREYGGICVCCM